jgi:hypothetical protein
VVSEANTNSNIALMDRINQKICVELKKSNSSKEKSAKKEKGNNNNSKKIFDKENNKLC